MDVDDEHTSYLKYLNDSETPNAYLLENNEVGLFSVEPIFTEIEAPDWPQEEFPLLLSNVLISEGAHTDPLPDNKVSCVTDLTDPLIENIESQNKDCINRSSIFKPIRSDDKLESISTHLSQKDIQTSPQEVKPERNEIEFDINREEGVSTEDCTLQIEENITTDNQIMNNDSPNMINIAKNQAYILIDPSTIENESDPIQLVTSDGTLLASDKAIFATIDLPISDDLGPENISVNISNLFSKVMANKCKICSYLCENREEMVTHITAEHGEHLASSNDVGNGASVLLSNVLKSQEQNTDSKKKLIMYICSECRGVYTNKMDLKKHMIQAHGLSGESGAPNKELSERKELEKKSHDKSQKRSLSDVNFALVKTQEKAMQKIKCSVRGCLATFPTEQHMKRHEMLHIGNTKYMFKCSECQNKFQMWSTLKGHMYTEHGMDFGMIICPMCNMFRSYKAENVLKHMMIHSEVKPFLCSDCGKSFKQLPQLKNHEAIHKLPEDMPTWSKVKKCDTCDRFFANSKSLKTHIKAIHENIKPFICNICGHKSSRKSMLELHIRQHTASKPHKCEHCNFRTGDPNSLRKHIMKHLGKKVYNCPHCPYSCIQAGSIKSHFVRRHKDKGGVYFCKYCSYSSINEDAWNIHQKFHETRLKDAESVDSKACNTTEIPTDEETQSFLNPETQIEETVDNGGITIPAGLELGLDA